MKQIPDGLLLLTFFKNTIVYRIKGQRATQDRGLQI